ncbi:MAG: phenylacetic acid degradation protein PaaN [Phycisphaerales bacterium]|nr:MAG: phenylacetic acid degradation protein PaaN [Phycisphaerales bacterium]
MTHPLFETHRKTLDAAVQAAHDRGFYSAYPEVPSGKIYGETAKDDGIAAFKARLNQPFEFKQSPPSSGTVGSEQSPYGFDLGISYPKLDVETAVNAAKAGLEKWMDAGPEARVGICLEILKRLNERSFELGNAVMHTTGQGFMMAFQAGGPHAQDRGLEGVAYAWQEMNRHTRDCTWTKQVSKTDFVNLKKTFHIVPRGIGAVIACSTFPTWNSYGAIFANLATGNATIVKPHPGAVLPLAITVDVIREVLAENGFDPNLALLLADAADEPITKELCTNFDVKIIDYTGSSEFGEWIEQNARQAVVFTEKAGVNSLIIDSVEDLKAVTGNLAFTISLYSGQMCTTSQNIYIPKDGIEVNGERMSFDDVAAAFVKAVDWFLGEPKRAVEVLGAIQNPATVERIEQAKKDGGEVLRDSGRVENEMFKDARQHSPVILKVDAAKKDLYMREMFGPIIYLVATDSTEQSIELARSSAICLGAITCGVYSTDDAVLDRTVRAMTTAGVPVSCNLTGHIFVNQSAAFSDFHVTGLNPAGNASLTDGAFVANRFACIQSRIPVPMESAAADQSKEVAGAKA